MRKFLRSLNVWRTIRELRLELQTIKITKKINENSEVKMVPADKKQGKTGIFLPEHVKMAIDAKFIEEQEQARLNGGY